MSKDKLGPVRTNQDLRRQLELMRTNPNPNLPFAVSKLSDMGDLQEKLPSATMLNVHLAQDPEEMKEESQQELGELSLTSKAS